MFKRNLKALEDKKNYNSLRSLRSDVQSNLIVPPFVKCTMQFLIVPEFIFRGEMYQKGTIVPFPNRLLMPQLRDQYSYENSYLAHERLFVQSSELGSSSKSALRHVARTITL